MGTRARGNRVCVRRMEFFRFLGLAVEDNNEARDGDAREAGQLETSTTDEQSEFVAPNVQSEAIEPDKEEDNVDVEETLSDEHASEDGRATPVIDETPLPSKRGQRTMTPAVLDVLASAYTEEELNVRRERLKKQSSTVYSSFKNKRRTSIAPTAPMLQALVTRAKQDALAHKQATVLQAQVLTAGRAAEVVAGEKKGHRRNRRITLGLDATLSYEAQLQLFQEQGTTDDLLRPENNAAGVVAPADRALIGKVMVKAEQERVEKLFKERVAPPQKHRPTVPKSPRIGLDAHRSNRSGSSRSNRLTSIPPYRAMSSEFLALAPKTRKPAPAAQKAHSPSQTAALPVIEMVSDTESVLLWSSSRKPSPTLSETEPVPLWPSSTVDSFALTGLASSAAVGQPSPTLSETEPVPLWPSSTVDSIALTGLDSSAAVGQPPPTVSRPSSPMAVSWRSPMVAAA